MLLQIAFDKPEHLALLPLVKPFADIVEIGTPVLKRFGVSAITTARELCPDVLVLADTKTVDGGPVRGRHGVRRRRGLHDRAVLRLARHA